MFKFFQLLFKCFQNVISGFNKLVEVNKIFELDLSADVAVVSKMSNVFTLEQRIDLNERYGKSD